MFPISDTHKGFAFKREQETKLPLILHKFNGKYILLPTSGFLIFVQCSRR